MKVVLTKQCPGLGIAGDIKEVAQGYARNFLFPMAIAKPFNGEVAVFRKALQDSNEKKKKNLAKKISHVHNALFGKVFQVPAKANKEGHLFAGVRERDIADIIQKGGIEVEPKDIKIMKAIKSLGEFDVQYAPTNVEPVSIKIKVIAQ